ncbi:MAG: hypothetical protein J0M34_00430 [Alphaproteobacteria bacterium]|nr:hypothetical protein [Alphaproteobacteria bacterium]
MRHAPFVIMLLLGLSACQGMGLGSLDTDEAKTFPGLDSLSTESEENKKEREWLDKFYGRKSASDSDCDFYGNCKSAQKSGLGW